MEYRNLGRSGLRVSALGLGTNNFGNRLDPDRVRGVLDAALELGVNFIDTADIYAGGQSETLIGEILGGRRNDVLIASKVGMPAGDSTFHRGSSRRRIFDAVEGSLKRLRTDWIDLYQLHRADPETPIEESLEALDDLVRQGKIRYHGHSNFAGWQIADAQWAARVRRLSLPVSAQHRYNLLDREVEAEVIPACIKHGLGLIPFLPLASGFLTGKYRSGATPAGSRLDGAPAAARVLTDANYSRLEKLEAFAAEHGHSILELALGWLLSRPEVSTVIAGASSGEQVKSNFEASSWRLQPAEMEALAAL
ncbi:MAG TPA: aldo/keto reductase [Candidatus Dormibacteraeota bacterium]|nr:aldo/keto reductase [Candidatus Dormibacteraeota bacterium]